MHKPDMTILTRHIGFLYSENCLYVPIMAIYDAASAILSHLFRIIVPVQAQSGLCFIAHFFRKLTRSPR
jgi:hypothetical protein